MSVQMVHLWRLHDLCLCTGNGGALLVCLSRVAETVGRVLPDILHGPACTACRLSSLECVPTVA